MTLPKAVAVPKNVSNTLTADSAIPCDTNSGTQCANENSDQEYLDYSELFPWNLKTSKERDLPRMKK